MNNGRIKIVCDLKPTGNISEDLKIIPAIIDRTKNLHDANVRDIKRLFDYYYNRMDICGKTKVQQPDINNIIAIDYPNIAVTTINGYCFSNSLTFSSRRTDNKDEMKAFADALDDDNYQNKLLKVALNTGICGLGYKYIMPANADEIKNGIYYKTFTDIDPQNTYCVYYNSLEDEKVCAISYYKRKKYDKSLTVISEETVYNVWTKYHQWEFVKQRGEWVNRKFEIAGTKFDAYPLPYKKIPIIEYFRQQDRTGDFEVAIDLINAINNIASLRVDAVQQNVDHVILLRDIDTESEGSLSKIKDYLKQGILSFKSIQNAVVQPSVDVLDTKLNQSEVQTLQQFLCDKVEEVMNIPNRETRSSGGDTGSAVESRNGFRSLENKASLVTTSILNGENEALDVILAICSNIPSCPFKSMKPKDIEIKDNRNKYENLTNASNAYATLRNAGMNDSTALRVTRLVSDEITTSELNKQEGIEDARRKIDQEVEEKKALASIEPQNNNGTNTDQ